MNDRLTLQVISIGSLVAKYYVMNDVHTTLCAYNGEAKQRLIRFPVKKGCSINFREYRLFQAGRTKGLLLQSMFRNLNNDKAYNSCYEKRDSLSRGSAFRQSMFLNELLLLSCNQYVIINGYTLKHFA